MAIKYHGCVDSEDGTLLFGDAKLLQFWSGSDAEFEQSQLIEKALQDEIPGLSVRIGQYTGIVWNIDGAGTVDVYSASKEHIILVRSWLDEDGNSAEIDTVSSLPIIPNSPFGEFTIQSGYLALLWSGESGSCIDITTDGNYFIRADDMMTESSGLIIPISTGTYRCFQDEVRCDTAEYRRCHIFKI